MALVHGNSMNLGVLHRGSAAQAYYAIPHVYTKFKPAGFASPTCQQAQHGDCVGSQVLDAQTDRTSFVSCDKLAAYAYCQAWGK